ncbi:MAG: hypothetical protein FJ298_16225, partial [Planctomycetes bacterium]|nr:hypothetical protein [Planctomycetota bacterium]
MARTFFAQVVLPTNASPSASHAIRFDKFLSKHAKDSVALATAAALPAYSRSANTITASANGALTVDGVAVSTGDRILVKDGAAAIDNGIYTVTATGGVGAPYVLDRATDFDESADVAKGCRTIAQGGSANAGKIFYISAFAGSLNSDGITFSSPAGTSYTASTGVTLSGSDFQLASSSAGAGLTFAAGVLDVVAADTSLTVGANNVGVNLAAGSGLQVSSGLKIQLEAANPTLAVVSSELGLKFDSNSFTKGSSGLAL